jgi:lipoprotein-anchoring transpeptidase ErfK/SrfK
MTRGRRCSLGFVAFAFAIAVTACGGGGSAQVKRAKPTLPPTTVTVPATTTTTIPPYITYIATVKPEITSVAVYPSTTAAQPMQEFPNPWLYEPDNPDTKVPQVFLVKTQWAVGWVQVVLPVRPNGTTGWVHASDVTLTPNPYHIGVSLSDHTITVTNANAVMYTGPVAVGAPGTPTPTGRFYLYVLLESPDPSGPYGPFAYGLSSHSDALATFDGGDAEIGIHGNADASVLGSSVSHGCVRMDNDAITNLSKVLPLGTPVDINA